ncbi:class I SAM-dependent methyltransferase [candidate division KSB1 bacterium]|nr:class I SAM-dependent methyltransferase [candidate division KSB1 bacterium]
MAKPRVVETNEGIQGEFDVEIYNRMQQRFRDKGWMETDAIIKSGIVSGHALEVGPGPGYLGLEWLKKTEGTKLTGLDISPDMIAIANRNAMDYGFTGRVEYVKSSGEKIPFGENHFDAAFTNGSLHEWAEPEKTLNEIWRVLKPDGKIFISDLRRDMSPFIKWFMWLATKPKEIRPGLLTSIAAAYTSDELNQLMDASKFTGITIQSNVMGLQIKAIKTM